LKILSSGEVIAARGVIASEPSSVGTVEVSGTGSMWEIAEDLTVGGTEAAQGGQGLLEVKSGGRVVVGGSYDGELRVWGGGVVDVTALGAVDVGRLTTPGPAGTLTLGGPGVLRGNGLIKGNVDARGWEGLVHEQEEYWATVAPGNATTGIGRLTINGNYTQRDDSFLEIQLAGPQQGVQHDELFVTGHATFDGILSISLNDGFIPVAGDAFKILDWSSHTGTYFHSLPTLPSGLRWNTGQLYSNGTLAVAPMQQTIARWTFEAGKPGNPVSASGTTLSGVSPAIGNGIASGFHASAATVWDNPAGNGSPESMSSNNWTVGDYYQFQINTEDMENIKLEFEQVSSSSGPRDFQLQYSTDGTAFTDFGAPYVVRTNATPAWGASTPSGLDYFYFDLSSLTAISDQSSVFFRLAVESNVSSSGGVIGTGGTSRLDNVTISGTQIVGLAGDFNDDGTVDGVDFLVWQRQLGGSVIPYSGADGDGNAVVNAADLNIWRDRYGNTSGLSSSTTATVPEPASIALFLLSPTLIACRPIRPRVAH
jgi:T5SS/PEP-CTERM-associated repeat protein